MNKYLKLALKEMREGKDICLHCLLMAAHKEKWPKYRGIADTKKNKAAFDDLVYAGTRMNAMILSQLDEVGQMKFIEKSQEQAKLMQGGTANDVRTKIRVMMEALLNGRGVVVEADDKPAKPKPN